MGATAGGLARYGVGHVWSGRGQALWPTVVLAAAAAGLIGFVLVASLRPPMKAVLMGAGGAAASISAAATLAASVTPVQSIIAVAVFVAGAVAGLLLGMLLARSVLRNAQREERR